MMNRVDERYHRDLKHSNAVEEDAPSNAAANTATRSAARSAAKSAAKSAADEQIAAAANTDVNE